MFPLPLQTASDSRRHHEKSNTGEKKQLKSSVMCSQRIITQLVYSVDVARFIIPHHLPSDLALGVRACVSVCVDSVEPEGFCVSQLGVALWSEGQIQI